MFFPGYATLKEAFAGPDGTTGLAGVLGAGGIAGAFAGGMATPQDVIKTRLQTKSCTWWARMCAARCGPFTAHWWYVLCRVQTMGVTLVSWTVGARSSRKKASLRCTRDRSTA